MSLMSKIKTYIKTTKDKTDSFKNFIMKKYSENKEHQIDDTIRKMLFAYPIIKKLNKIDISYKYLNLFIKFKNKKLN